MDYKWVGGGGGQAVHRNKDKLSMKFVRAQKLHIKYG